MVRGLEKKHYMYATLVITGSILVSLLVIFFLIKPLYISKTKISKEIKDKKETLNALENKLSKLKELKSREEELKKEKERVLAALPEDKEVSRLFVQFEKMVSDTGANTESAKEITQASESAPSEGTAGANIPGTNSYSYEIKFNTSTYESFKNVIDNLEKALRLLNLNKIDIEVKDDNTLSINFGINTYSRKTQE